MFDQSSLLSAFFGPTTVINRVPSVSSGFSGEVTLRSHIRQRVSESAHIDSQRLFHPVPQVARNPYEATFGMSNEFSSRLHTRCSTTLVNLSVNAQ